MTSSALGNPPQVVAVLEHGQRESKNELHRSHHPLEIPKPLPADSNPSKDLSIIQKWFQGQHDERDTAEIVREAYGQARKSLTELMKTHRREEVASLLELSSMDDALEAVRAARDKYVEKKKRRHRVDTALSSWWVNAAARITCFGSVIDTFISSNPEYSALAWGAIKFLFMVTLNNQELSSNIAEAFASIGEALPEVHFIALDLYPVAHIQRTLAKLYVHILDFCVRAFRWYERATKSRLRQAMIAIKNPWALEFADVVRQVRETTSRLREQAAVAHQAETKHVGMVMMQIRQELAQLQEARLQTNLRAPIQFSGPDAAPIPRSPPASQIPSIASYLTIYLADVSIDPQKGLQTGLISQQRRRARDPASSDSNGAWNSARLLQWIRTPGSSLLQLRGSKIRSEASRDFAFDIIQVLKSLKLPVVWYVAFPLHTTSAAAKVTPRHIIATLVSQVLAQVESSGTVGVFDHSTMSEASSDRDWLRLLAALLGKVPWVAVIIDTYGHGPQIQALLRDLHSSLVECHSTSAIKLMLLTYSELCTTGLSFGPGGEASDFQLQLNRSKRSGAGRGSLDLNKRRPRGTKTQRDSGLEKFRKTVMSSLGNEKFSLAVQ